MMWIFEPKSSPISYITTPDQYHYSQSDPINTSHGSLWNISTLSNSPKALWPIPYHHGKNANNTKIKRTNSSFIC